jgi:hypothetical protein
MTLSQTNRCAIGTHPKSGEPKVVTTKLEGLPVNGYHDVAYTKGLNLKIGSAGLWHWQACDGSKTSA